LTYYPVVSSVREVTRGRDSSLSPWLRSVYINRRSYPLRAVRRTGEGCPGRARRVGPNEVLTGPTRRDGGRPAAGPTDADRPATVRVAPE
jgi:hypothetical protein